ncbi:pepsin/retropepsin-like aspartic protease family protein [Brevundimonas sp.]|uniref:pepsin/retropepsin-like aspartic protease family protein n=1 Tax=Brevundimonas sp. TaxID=1871086 RepID=UPI002FD8C0B3
MSIGLDRRAALLGAGAFSLLGAASARADADTPVVETDRLGRMTLPVFLNERGPFRFALDSAASMSMVAEDLIAPLGLDRDADVTLHTLLAGERARTVRAERLRCGALYQIKPRLAVGSRVGMAGLDGLISASVLNQNRVLMNFRGDRMTIGRSRARGRSDFATDRSVPFRSPDRPGFQNLIMVDAGVGGRPVTAIVDTGAQSSIANTALIAAAGGQPAQTSDGSRTRPVQSATGAVAEARMMVVRDLNFGPLSLERVPVLVGDFHTFDVWGLADRPAMLLGVDLLGVFQSVAIDFKRRDLTFEI